MSNTPEEKAIWDRMGAAIRVRSILFLICMVTIVFVGELSEQDSCIRGQSVRNGLNYASKYFAHSAKRFELRAKLDASNHTLMYLDLQSAQAARDASKNLYVHQLSCSFPFPSTK